jgi:hypothetical protein
MKTGVTAPTMNHSTEATMKKLSSILLAIAVLLTLANPSAASVPTAGTSGAATIYAAAVCKDSAIVTVNGTSTNATNRIRVRLNAPDANGKYYLHKETYSGNFGSGDFTLPIVVSYSQRQLVDGKLVYIDVQLQGLSGNTFVDLGPQQTVSATVADKFCKNKCLLTISSTDKAPVNGVITLRTHYGSLFRPEGRLYGAMPVSAGQRLQNTFPALPCNFTARVWYYPSTGKDRTPRLLNSQYWPDGYGLSGDPAIVYATSFARSVKATAPLEPDDPYAP